MTWTDPTFDPIGDIMDADHAAQMEALDHLRKAQSICDRLAQDGIADDLEPLIDRLAAIRTH